MKQSTAVGGGGGGGAGLGIPTEDEVEVLEILLSLKKLIAKSELLSRYSFTWGRKKKRSVLVSKSEPSPPSKNDEKSAAVEADKSPSTPLSFLPSASGSDGGGDKSKPQQSHLQKNSKKRTTEDFMEKLDAMTQQREILLREIKGMRNLHQELTTKNLELKTKRQEIIFSRNTETLQLWKNTMKMNLNQRQQHYHQRISIFAPPQQQHCQEQFMVDLQPYNNGGGGRLGLFNQMAPRVKIHGESFDFMLTPPQPLDQNIDNDLRVRAAAAAAARQRRVMKRKENRNSLLAMKMASRGCR